MLRLAQIGNFDPTHSSENHFKISLEQLGHQVQSFQENRNTIDSILKEIDFFEKPDLLIYTRTWGFPGSEKMREELDKRNIPSVTIHLDCFTGISRESDIGNDFFWNTSYVFTPEGSEESRVLFKQRGVNHFYLPPGVLKDGCYLAEPDPKYTHDIAFVGSYGYHFEWGYRQQLIDWLSMTYGDKFKLFPGDGIPAIREHDLNVLYASTKIAIGDSLNARKLPDGSIERFNIPYYWSDRAHEAPGRGAFQIFPWIKGLDEMYTDRENIVFYKFGDFKQLKATIDYYLKYPEEREAIRLAGHLHTKEHHTYTERMQEMLTKIAEYEPQIKEKLCATL